MTQIKDSNGNWVTVAGGQRMWVGTKAQLDAALAAGELEDNTLTAVLDDYTEGDSIKPVTATIVNSKAHSDSFIWVNRIGHVVQVAAKFAWNPGVQVSFLETWATGLPKPIHMLWPLAVAFAGRAGNPALPLQFTVNGELKLDNGWPEYLAEYPDSRCFDAYATFTYITDDPF